MKNDIHTLLQFALIDLVQQQFTYFMVVKTLTAGPPFGL